MNASKVNKRNKKWMIHTSFQLGEVFVLMLLLILNCPIQEVKHYFRIDMSRDIDERTFRFYFNSKSVPEWSSTSADDFKFNYER
jgi:hypothetical protein